MRLRHGIPPCHSRRPVNNAGGTGYNESNPARESARNTSVSERRRYLLQHDQPNTDKEKALGLTTLGQSLRNATAQHPRKSRRAMYDNAAYRVVGNTIILAHMAKVCVVEARGMSVEDIAKCVQGKPLIRRVPVERDEVAAPEPKVAGEPGASASESDGGTPMHEDFGMAPIGETVDRTLYEGSARYDIRFTLELPGMKREIVLIINVEVQNKDDGLSYPLDARKVAYACHLVSAQGLDYANIEKAYSIWIVTEPEDEAVENTIDACALCKVDLDGTPTGGRVSEDMDKIQIVTINLGDPEKADPKAGDASYLLRLLDTLFDTSMPFEEKKDTLEGTYHIPVAKELEKEIKEMSSLGAQIATNNFSKGWQDGWQKGRQNGTIQTCLFMGMDREATVSLVARQYGISSEEAETAYDECVASLES